MRITTQKQYKKCLKEVKDLVELDPEPTTRKGKRLTKLADSLIEYEKKRYPLVNEELLSDKKKKKCPLCRYGVLTRKSVKTTYKYKENSVRIMQPGEWCNMCKEGFLNTKDMEGVQDLLKALWKFSDSKPKK